MRATFWGTRGSISAPGPGRVRYGANTACVSLQVGDHRLILDAGFGIVLLADRIMAWRRPREPLRLPLFLSHLHWDHVIGLPFFTPVFFKNVELDIWGRSADVVSSATERLFTSTYSPINGIQNLGATLRYHTMPDEPVVVGPFRVTHALARHPSATLSYRMEAEGKSFVYLTDHEAGDPAFDEGLLALAEGADVLVHDAQWTEEEAVRYQGYGHSSWAQAVETAKQAGVGTLVLFHHHHRHDDDTLDEMGRLARKASPASLDVIVARDGLVVQP